VDTVKADRTKARAFAALGSIAVVSGAVLAGCGGPRPVSTVSSHPAGCGQVVACGEVTDVAGQAVEGVRVYLYAWPASWPGRNAVYPGERVPLQLVGSTVSTSSGHYAVPIEYPTAVRSSATRDGIVNLEVFAGTRAVSGAYSFPGRVVTLSGRMALAGPNGRGKAPSTGQEVNIHLMNSGEAESSAGPIVTSLAGFFCIQTTTLVRPEPLEWMKLAASFARSSGVTMTYTYTIGQSSSVGVGISPTGAPGTFTVSGTYAVSASQAISFPPVSGPGSVFYETGVKPGLFETTWNSPVCGSTIWQTQAIEIAGGTNEASTTPPDAALCTFYQSGSSLDLDNSEASTFSTGLTINELGFNASSQTSYDKDGSLLYDITVGQYLCGQDNYPAGNNPGPGLVVVGKPA